MPVPLVQLNQTATRQRASRTQNSAGEWVETWNNPDYQQSILCNIFPRQGKPTFDTAGRTDTSTHIMVFNMRQYTSPLDGVGVPSDVRNADRIQDQGGKIYRVDFVDNPGGLNDHMEAHLTLMEPGDEAQAN